MNKFVFIFGILLFIVAVNGRHYEARSDSESLSEEEDQSSLKRDRVHTGLNRHRRRRWQTNYGYDYQPQRHYDRRDYYQNQDLIPQIFRLLDEIAEEVRRRPPPPPPPQPIYIPYPVPYYIPQYVPCTTNVTKKPNITQRFPDMEDPNQNWGFETPDENDYDDGLDGQRPISFDKIKPKKTMTRPSPPVEHGSSQNEATTRNPLQLERTATATNMVNMCLAMSLSCCSFDDKTHQKQCFTNAGCGKTYANKNPCSAEAITAALNMFQNAYAPKL